MAQELNLNNMNLSSNEAIEENDSPVVRVRRAMQGRYLWAIGLGLLGLLIGGGIGYIVPTPLYESRGTIRLTPSVQRIMYSTDQNDANAKTFENFIASQIQLVTSGRVIDLAVNSETWRRHQTGDPNEVSRVFAQSIVLPIAGKQSRNSEFISFGFRHPNAQAAMDGMRALMESYQSVYREMDIQSGSSRMQVLEERRTALNNQLRGIRANLMAATDDLGVEAFNTLCNSRLASMSQQEQELKELQLNITAAQTAAGMAAPPSPTTQPSDQAAEQLVKPSYTPQQIAAVDSTMRAMLAQQRDLQLQIEAKGLTLGANHRVIFDLRNRLEMLDREIARYARDFHGGSSALTSHTSESGKTSMTLDEMKAREKALIALINSGREKLVELTKKREQIDQLKQEEATVLERFDETRQRIEQLNVEAAAGGRMNIANTGDQARITVDMRPRYAVLGAGAGFAAGFGIILVIGLLDPRLRSAGDALITIKGAPMLGVLPVLPDDLAEPAQINMVNHCVHQIRTLLQLSGSNRERPCFAVTSPAPETGKTCLTLALGISFAASGARTLMIDGDLGGGGLTSRVDAIARRRLGQIVQKQGLINDQQLEHALREAQLNHKRIGETLVELGYLSPEQVEQAIGVQQAYHVGLMDAVAGEPFEHCVASAGLTNLSVLPLGTASSHDLGKLSPQIIRTLIQQTRQHFDVVIFDTGPIPASPEATMIAAQVDGVVLVITKGEQKPLADRAVAHLKSIGAKVAGCVFNRADERDLDRSGYTMTRPQPLALRQTRRGQRFDPIARAMAQVSRNGSNGQSKSAVTQESADLQHPSDTLSMGRVTLSAEEEMDALRDLAKASEEPSKPKSKAS